MAGPRPDITDNLVHYIRGDTLDAAFAILKTIMRERTFRCGTGYIKGGHCCICFSEAPFKYLGDAIARGYAAQHPYQPFGVLVNRHWLFARGGRPVIYQPEVEYPQLPESHRWRHVRYDLIANAPVDFTWEREWRIRVDTLPIDWDVAHLIVPSKGFFDALHRGHKAEQDLREDEHRLIFDELTAWQLREDFKWQVHVLAPDGSVSP